MKIVPKSLHLLKSHHHHNRFSCTGDTAHTLYAQPQHRVKSQVLSLDFFCRQRASLYDAVFVVVSFCFGFSFLFCSKNVITKFRQFRWQVNHHTMYYYNYSYLELWMQQQHKSYHKTIPFMLLASLEGNKVQSYIHKSSWIDEQFEPSQSVE